MCVTGQTIVHISFSSMNNDVMLDRLNALMQPFAFCHWFERKLLSGQPDPSQLLIITSL